MAHVGKTAGRATTPKTGLGHYGLNRLISTEGSVTNKEWNKAASLILRKGHERNMADHEADKSLRWLNGVLEGVSLGYKIKKLQDQKQ